MQSLWQRRKVTLILALKGKVQVILLNIPFDKQMDYMDVVAALKTRVGNNYLQYESETVKNIFFRQIPI